MKPYTQPTPLSSRSTPEPLVAGRRGALQAITAAAALLTLGGLGGCGFALRRAPTFAFDAIRFTGNEDTPVSRGLQRALMSAGLRMADTTTPGQTPALAEPRTVVLHVITDRRERVVAGQTDSGQVRELTLRARFRYTLSTPGGKVLLGDSELLLERDISFSETAALAKRAEEQTMFSDMDNDIVQQVLRRLAAVKSL
jgi:LPS-assembly lipoprotein